MVWVVREYARLVEAVGVLIKCVWVYIRSGCVGWVWYVLCVYVWSERVYVSWVGGHGNFLLILVGDLYVWVATYMTCTFVIEYKLIFLKSLLSWILEFFDFGLEMIAVVLDVIIM